MRRDLQESAWKIERGGASPHKNCFSPPTKKTFATIAPWQPSTNGMFHYLPQSGASASPIATDPLAQQQEQETWQQSCCQWCFFPQRIKRRGGGRQKSPLIIFSFRQSYAVPFWHPARHFTWFPQFSMCYHFFFAGCWEIISWESPLCDGTRQPSITTIESSGSRALRKSAWNQWAATHRVGEVERRVK